MSVLGEQLKEEGIVQGFENASNEWKQEAIRCVHTVASNHSTFTTNDVWNELGSIINTHDNRAMGGVMRYAAKQGWIEPTSTWVKSDRPSQHRQPIMIWASLVRKEGHTDV